uniref:Uncharacterized protein n=1 Tax=Setaria italica TaxID=4555 RepID=K3YWT9_SETIT
MICSCKHLSYGSVTINGALVHPGSEGKVKITQILSSSTGSNAQSWTFPPPFPRGHVRSRMLTAHPSSSSLPRTSVLPEYDASQLASGCGLLDSSVDASSTARQLMMLMSIIPRYADGV